VLAAFLALGMAAVSATAKADDGPQRFYDRMSDCAVYDIGAFPTEAANWDGPCRDGLATGRGTATYFGGNGRSEMISADFREGMILDGAADIRWSDGARYSGEIVDGRPEGTGVLVNGKGDRFEGEWKDGKLNGHGSVAWTNGDRYEGDWVDGKAEGHGVQVWADGQKYDGAWSNDQPNGQGTVTRRDGSQYSAIFVNGKRQDVAAAPPPPAKPAAPVTSVASAASSAPPSRDAAPQADVHGAPHSFIDGMTDVTLTAVDGSTLSLAASEGGITRKLTAADGTVQTAIFTFLGPNLGSVADDSDPRRVTGLFRVTANGVAVDYSDGHSELLRRDASGGLFLTARSASGAAACAAWYPQGHQFSVAERRAAVAAYARRLGVADRAGVTSGCAEQPAPVVMPASRPASHTAPRHVANVPAVTPLTRPNTASLQTIPVRDSSVRLIDAPVAATTPGSAAVPADERIASNCLKVDSDGSYWGFRNHCGYSVQFVYCLLHGVNPMTACGDKNASVSGSVSANGFGALFADESLGERDAEHQFRWVGCRGGAGEVIAQLDHAEPASGQCVRTKTARRDN